MQQFHDITDPRIAKMLGHPLRIKLLGILERRIASPNEIVELMGYEVALGTISYHMRVLHELGFTELVREVPRRGAVEHYYSAIRRPLITVEKWNSLPSITKRAAIAAHIGEIGTHVNAAVTSGCFNVPDVHVSRASATLDEIAWEALAARLNALRAKTRQIEADSLARLAADARATRRPANVVMMLFAPAPDASPDGAQEKARGASTVAPGAGPAVAHPNVNA